VPSDKTKAVLKSFGEGANVLLQDSLSKSSRASGVPDISDGEAVDVTTQGSPATGSVQNPLGRAPIGAFIVQFPDTEPRAIAVRATEADVSLFHFGTPGTFTLWVF
jgi:hypothetical protein